jgi:hypothetical protein
MLESSDAFTSWPTPNRSRAHNAVTTPKASIVAPIWSAIPPATAHGGISGSPAAIMIPDRAWPR